MFSTLFSHRELLYELTQREIKSRYKQSILGYAWVIINPLAQMLVMSFVFSVILRVDSAGAPYPLFLYVGLLPWTLFTTSLISSCNVLVSNANLVKKIYFPRELLIASTIIAKVVDFLLASTVLIAFFLFFQHSINWQILWVIPIFFIQQVFTYGLSLMVAAFNLFYRDIQYVLNLFIIVWMYLTPIIYPIEMIPEQYRFIFIVNPMAVLINAYRQTMLGQGWPNVMNLGLATILSFATCILGWIIFKKLEKVFADIV